MREEGFLAFIDGVIQKNLPVLHRIESIREEVIQVNRRIIFESSKAIESVHAKKFDEALQYIERAKLRLIKTREELGKEDASSLLDKMLESGEREFFEAALTYSFARSAPPGEILGEIDIKPIPLIMGIVDFTGELRRIFLDALVEGELHTAEESLRTIRHIYSTLIGLDVRVSMLPGFRKRLDIIRSQMERSTENLHLSRVSQRLRKS